MSFEQVWPELSALRSPDIAERGMDWKVLYAGRPRPLLVPTREPEHARAAIDFFVRSPLLRWWGHSLLTIDRWFGAAQLLPSVRLEHFPSGALFGFGGCADMPFAVHCGSPGPLQKATIFCPAPGGELGKVTKVALRASADSAIDQEAHWLRTLAARPETAAFLPRLYAEGKLACGRRYVTMSVLPNGRVSTKFGDGHYAFLAALAEQGCGPSGPWSQSDAHARLRDRTAAIAGLVEPQYLELLEAALHDVERLIGARDLPNCVAHGDFAPWNVRVTPDKVFVFDWEYAQQHASPLQDFLHFHLITRATQRWTIGSGYVRQLNARAAAHARRLFGPESDTAGAAGGLTLHYLLDTVTFYIETSRYLDTQHPVIRVYTSLISQRSAWLPASQAAGH